MGVDRINSDVTILSPDFVTSEGSFTLSSNKLNLDVTWEKATQFDSVLPVNSGCRSSLTFVESFTDTAGYSGFKTTLKDSAECFGEELTTKWAAIPIDESFNLNQLAGKQLILTGIKSADSTCKKPIAIEFSAIDDKKITIEKVAPVDLEAFEGDINCGSDLEKFGWGSTYYGNGDKKLASSPKTDSIMIIDLGSNQYAPQDSHEQMWVVKPKGDGKLFLIWAGDVDWSGDKPTKKDFSFDKVVAVDYEIKPRSNSTSQVAY
jgi:hypothetical protein